MKKSPVIPPVVEETNDPEIRTQKSVKKQIFVSLSVLLLIIAVTILVIMYGKGYRIFVQNGQPTLSNTGILNLSSDPTAAQVFINGHLTTATNNSLNLTPG